MKRGFIILLVFIVFTVILVSHFHFASSAVLLDRIVATVNDEVITWSELMKVITSEGRQMLENVPDEVRKKRIKKLERPYLNNLIEIKLQLQEARAMGLSVSKNEIDSAIADIMKKFNLSDEVFERSLKSENMTMSDYRTKLADQILVQKVVNAAVKTKIVIPAEEIEEYYTAHRADYGGEEQVKIRQIFLALPDEDADRADVEARGQKLFQKLADGEDFALVAREFSEGPSREFGGDLGYIGRGSALKEIEEAADALGIGEVSRPFWSSAGLHIIKLEERSKGRSIEAVREQIKQVLEEKAFQSDYHDWMSGLREKAHIDIKL